MRLGGNFKRQTQLLQQTRCAETRGSALGFTHAFAERGVGETKWSQKRARGERPPGGARRGHLAAETAGPERRGRAQGREQPSRPIRPAAGRRFPRLGPALQLRTPITRVPGEGPGPPNGATRRCRRSPVPRERPRLTCGGAASARRLSLGALVETRHRPFFELHSRLR